MPDDARRLSGERGVVLLIVLLAMVLLTALGLSLTLLTSTEGRIAFTYGRGLETFYAADALLERIVADLGGEPDWSAALDGRVRSGFSDGPSGIRTRPDGMTLDLAVETSMLTCRRPACTEADMVASTEERPWGANNPRWRLYASGPFATMGAIDSRTYLAAWVADDPSENDGRPERDGDETAGANPGRDCVSVLVRAYGVGGAQRTIAATIARGRSGALVLTWREVRR